MKKKLGFKKIIVSMLVVATMLASIGALTLMADPGDASDPVVTLSYIEDVLKEEMSFKVVTLGNGERLMCEAGTELILRMGSATVIATQKGGLADVTQGVDLANKSSVPLNHHLVVPLADGRGIKANDYVLVMVKGDFEIK